MKIYLVRHGETTGNRDNFHQVPETPLTETGIEQAKKIAKRLRNRKIDLIYSSSHVRAKETAEIISESIGAPVELWENLTEIRRPKEMRGQPSDDPKIKRIENLIFKNFGNNAWKYSDEENFNDLIERSHSVIDHLLSNHKDQTIVCVSHGTFIKAVAATAMFGDSLTAEIFSTLRHRTYAENTGLSILEHTKRHGWRLLTWNDSSHL